MSRLAAALSAICALWAVWLFLFGGFDVTLAGLTIKSHDPFKLLLIASVALVIAMVTGSDDAIVHWLRRGARASHRLYQSIAGFEPSGRLDDVAAMALAITVTIVGFVHGSKAVGASDYYGYISEAELFLHGRVSVPQPWVKDVPWPNAAATFTPLAYVPQPSPTFTLFGHRPPSDPWSIVPTYSPGLPLLMAGAKLIGGQDALFWVVPISGGLLVLMTYLIGRRLGVRRAGLIASFLVAASPPFLTFLLVSMSDVPVAAALALACWCALGWTMRSAAAGGIALALMLLIRPNLVPLISVFVLWFGLLAVRDSSARWRHILRGVVILSGASLGMATTSAIYWFMYGTPTQSGYGSLTAYFATSHIVPNLRNYTAWFSDAQTPFAYLGIAALFVPAARLWPGVRHHVTLPIFGLMTLIVWAEFCYFLVFDDSMYLRFLLSTYPFIMLGFAGVLLAFARFGRRGAPIVVAVVVGIIGIRGFTITSASGYFHLWNVEAKYLDVAEHVRHRTPENSVVLAAIHSGNIRYVGGRVTMRWDVLPGDWLDRAVAWMAERGVRTYALLDDSERDRMRERCAGQTLAAVLDAPPVFQFGNKYFYDFGAAPGGHDPEVIPVVDLPRRSVHPAPEPTLEWNKR